MPDINTSRQPDGRRVAGLVFGLVLVTSASAAAQSARSAGALPIPFCSDSTISPFRERLLLVLEYDGANRRDMWSAIDMAADMHPRCIVSRGYLPPADSDATVGD